MTTALQDILKFEPPDGWVAADVPHCAAFAPVTELLAADGDIHGTRLSLSIALHNITDGSTATDAVERLMRRRVPRGAPDRFRATVAGVIALGFDWTDGVNNVLSFFVPLDTVVVEFDVGASAFTQPPLPEPQVVSDTLLAGVAWRRPDRATPESGGMKPR